MKNKILVTGGSGVLGTEIVKRLSKKHYVVAPGHTLMNVSNQFDVEDTFKKVDPEYVIHTAAMTDVRRCESEWNLAKYVNVTGTKNVAIAARNTHTKMIHISTACVFDGEHAPYHEESKPGPKNWYSMTKLMAEEVVLACCTDYLLIRTNFVARAPWKYSEAFTDRFGTYLYADDVAYAISTLFEDTHGTVHVCGDKQMSMHEIATTLSPDVKEITMNDYQGPSLTRNMSLVTTKIKPFTLGCARDLSKS